MKVSDLAVGQQGWEIGADRSANRGFSVHFLHTFCQTVGNQGTGRTDDQFCSLCGSVFGGSFAGFQLNEIDGATRKRRVERQRK